MYFNRNISVTAHKQRTVGLPQRKTLPRSTANSTVTICSVLIFKRQTSDFLNVWTLKIRPWPSLQTLSSIYPLTQHHIPEEWNSHVYVSLTNNTTDRLGTAVAQWLRCCATNRKVAGSIPAGVSGFFIDIKFSNSNRNEYQEYILGVKAAGA